MGKAEILCLYDDGAMVGTQLIGGSGASLLIDVDDERTLFNTGARGSVLSRNMSLLDIDANSVDRIVLSHGSLKVMGGLDTFMNAREKKVTVHSNATYWNIKRLFGGKILSDENALGIEHMYTGEDWVQLSKNLFVTPIVSETSMETALVLSTNEGAVVFSACGCDGIEQTLGVVSRRFNRIYALVGGITLHKLKQPEVNRIASEIRDTFGVRKLVLNGCTGAEGIQKMRVAVGNSNVADLFVGYRLEFQTY